MSAGRVALQTPRSEPRGKGETAAMCTHTEQHYGSHGDRRRRLPYRRVVQQPRYVRRRGPALSAGAGRAARGGRPSRPAGAGGAASASWARGSGGPPAAGARPCRFPPACQCGRGERSGSVSRRTMPRGCSPGSCAVSARSSGRGSGPGAAQTPSESGRRGAAAGTNCGWTPSRPTAAPQVHVPC
jgi:hypothetical protein